MHLATSISRPNLISMGTCFGRFSKSGKFKLTITCLDWLAKYAKYKVSGKSVGCILRGGEAMNAAKVSCLSFQINGIGKSGVPGDTKEDMSKENIMLTSIHRRCG